VVTRTRRRPESPAMSRPIGRTKTRVDASNNNIEKPKVAVQADWAEMTFWESWYKSISLIRV